MRNKILAAILGTCAIFGIAFVVHASPLEIHQSNTTATTTVSYMTPGTGTTTYYYDSYGSGYADPNAADRANMLVQFTASSTSSRAGLRSRATPLSRM